jgi:hypothetical protein
VAAAACKCALAATLKNRDDKADADDAPARLLLRIDDEL